MKTQYVVGVRHHLGVHETKAWLLTQYQFGSEEFGGCSGCAYESVTPARNLACKKKKKETVT